MKSGVRRAPKKRGKTGNDVKTMFDRAYTRAIRRLPVRRPVKDVRDLTFSTIFFTKEEVEGARCKRAMRTSDERRRRTTD